MKSELINRIGQRFGRLTVTGRAADGKTGRNRWVRWVCMCDCRAVVIVGVDNLRTRDTRSCGCLRREMTSMNRTIHGHARQSLLTPEYSCWRGMISRCTNPRNHAFARYGGRGIFVCARWLDSFEAFLVDMGRKPGVGMSIERIDNDRWYEPGNCKWATAKEQANNHRRRRDARMLEWQGESRTLTEWALLVGISVSTLWSRIRMGWSSGRALTTPLQGTK